MLMPNCFGRKRDRQKEYTCSIGVADDAGGGEPVSQQPLSVADVGLVLRLRFGYGIFWVREERGIVFVEPCHHADAELVEPAAGYLRALGCRAFVAEGNAERIVLTGLAEAS